jgi:hypothetical protein
MKFIENGSISITFYRTSDPQHITWFPLAKTAISAEPIFNSNISVMPNTFCAVYNKHLAINFYLINLQIQTDAGVKPVAPTGRAYLSLCGVAA